MKTFSIYFIDVRDGEMNHKILKAECIEHACAYMKSLGHEITKIEEVTE